MAGRFDGTGEGAGIEVVHDREITHVQEEYFGLNDVGDIRAGGVEDGLEVGQYLFGLLGDGVANDLSGLWVKRDLAGYVEHIAGLHRL